MLRIIDLACFFIVIFWLCDILMIMIFLDIIKYDSIV